MNSCNAEVGTERGPVRELWQRLRTHWNRTDTLMVAVNHVALIAMIGNCWWQSLSVCYWTLIVAIGIEVFWALGAVLWKGPYRGPLADALTFGLIVAALWPLGEGILVHTLGWWGEYLALGPKVWETPLYCMLVGWGASAWCAYAAYRTLDLGYSQTVAAVVMGATAFLAGTFGENLFVLARIWVYEPTNLALVYVPAFVPIGYGIAYAAFPLFPRSSVTLSTLYFSAVAFGVIVGLGLLTGFFPRPA